MMEAIDSIVIRQLDRPLGAKADSSPQILTRIDIKSCPWGSRANVEPLE